jgi:hypothetical protein
MVKHALPGLQQLELDLVMSRTDVSIAGDPRCEECMLCTAASPDAVLTVRTYGTRRLYDPGSVGTFSCLNPRTCKSQRRDRPRPGKVSQGMPGRTDRSGHRNMTEYAYQVDPDLWW